MYIILEVCCENQEVDIIYNTECYMDGVERMREIKEEFDKESCCESYNWISDGGDLIKIYGLGEINYFYKLQKFL